MTLDARRRPRRGACGSRTRRPRASRPAIVTEDEEAAERFLDGYRGTAAFWNATTRFTDGFELTGAPGDGHQRRRAPGPARPGDLSRPLAAPVPRRRRRHPAPVTPSSSSSARASSSTRAARSGARVLGARAREIAALVRGGEPVCVVSSGAIALGLPQLGLERRPRAMPQLQAASALGQARLQPAWERGARARKGSRPRRSCSPAATSPTERPT